MPPGHRALTVTLVLPASFATETHTRTAGNVEDQKSRRLDVRNELGGGAHLEAASQLFGEEDVGQLGLAIGQKRFISAHRHRP